MSAQFNDPPVFGGPVNANIDANRNTPLDLVGGADGYPLYSAPVLQNIFYDLGKVTINVYLEPFNYPPRNGNVIFKWRPTGSQQYTPFTSNQFLIQPPLTAWVGETTAGIQEQTAYEIIATSGVYSSPILRLATGTPPSNQPTAPPTIPISATVPTSDTIIVYFNVGFVGGGFPSLNEYSVVYGETTTTSQGPVTAVNAFGSLYTATITGLSSSTGYFVRSIVTSDNGTVLISEPSAIITTAVGGGVAPSIAPYTPVFAGATSSSITVTFLNIANSGTPNPNFGVYVGTTVTPDVDGVFIAATITLEGLGVVTATNLVAGTNYYFMSSAQNGVLPNANSAVSAAFQTGGPAPPVSPLITNAVTPFLIQGPRFNTPATTVLDYYINVDAVGCFYAVGANTKAQGSQLYGSMFAGSVTGVEPNNTPSQAGLCIADQPYNTAFGPTSDAYLEIARGNGNTRLLTSWGGFYADILGLFGPYQPAGPDGWINPTSVSVTTSFLYNFCRKGNQNPLNWRRTGYRIVYDGLILDFENVGYGGNPNVGNQYPLPQNPAPMFPASAADPKYSAYPQALANIVTTFNAIAPDLFLGNAPVSLSICQAETLAAPRGGNICAADSALNTWFAFASASTVPNKTNYNATASLALNHPNQMAFFDDIFVQFYNENAVNYLGGANFANLLAQWGYVAILAQREAIGIESGKVPKINIGLASGNIIPGFNAAGNAIVPSAQGPTPPLDGDPGPPFTYWYPQYGAGTPPNQTNPAEPQTWPNTGPILDAVNLQAAIAAANSILQTGFGNPTLVPSDWCSGMGFWAGGNATTMAQAVYSGQAASSFSPGNILPQQNVYVWSDASYPAPDPGWVSKRGESVLPIANGLSPIGNQRKNKSKLPFNN